MYNEKTLGGRYFTLKGNKNDNMDTLTINVSDIKVYNNNLTKGYLFYQR